MTFQAIGTESAGSMVRIHRLLIGIQMAAGTIQWQPLVFISSRRAVTSIAGDAGVGAQQKKPGGVVVKCLCAWLPGSVGMTALTIIAQLSLVRIVVATGTLRSSAIKLVDGFQ